LDRSNLNLAIDSNGSIGDSYFGTNAQTVMPTVSCNPGPGLGANQRARLSCFGIPTLLGGMFSPNGPRDLGYMRGPTYFDSDLALYKTFKVTEKQSAEFRFSAFNFLNHPVPSFSTNDQMRLTYTTGSGFAPNPGSTAGFGNLDYKDGKREIEVALKYIF
jgi:hypothetical protein